MTYPGQRRSGERGRLWEALVVLGLLLLPLLFWWRLWAIDPADRAVIPEGDFSSQYYPLQLFAARELVAGQLPAWNPYLNGGQPGLADPQMGTFYPPNLLVGLVRSLLGQSLTLGVAGLTLQVILHFSLASLFTYLFVRQAASRAGARPPAARFAGAVAALSFTYAGYLTSFPVQQLTILETAIWLPLVLFFLDRALVRPRRVRPAVLAAIALACALLAGHPQTAMYVVYATLAYGLYRALSTSPGSAPGIHKGHEEHEGQESTGKGEVRRWGWLGGVISLLAILALGAALAAVQLVPTLAFIGRSTRAGLDYDAVAWGFPLAEMTHLLYPGYFGGSPQYVGILPLLLAGTALTLRQARLEVRFWLLLGAMALLLAFGGHTFLYNLFYLLVPGFGAVRNQERIIYLFGFAVSVLAGYGALALVQPLPLVARRWFQRYGRAVGWLAIAFAALTAVFYFGYLQGLQQGVEINMFEGALRHHVLLLMMLGGTFALFALRSGWSGRAPRPWLAGLALSLIGLNLFTVNWRYNLAEPPAGGSYPETGLVTFLKEQPGIFRISSAGLLPGGSSAGIVYDLEDITANTPLRLAAFQRFEDQVGDWRRWQLLNVQYVLDRRDLDTPGLEPVYEEPGVKVYRLGDPLPRAWVVHETLTADDDRAIEMLNASDWDPRRTAILPSEGGVSLQRGGSGQANPVRVVEARPGRLVLDVTASEAGLLVVSQPFYPGWRARVNGQPVSIERVDYVLQAVPVEAGPQEVELTYRLSWRPALVSLVALAACLACGVQAFRGWLLGRRA